MSNLEVKEKDPDLCVTDGCYEKTHGMFHICKVCFHKRHRVGNFYKWTPVNVGFQLLMAILICYKDIIDPSMIKESDIKNGTKSMIKPICVKCGYDKWTLKIGALINTGTKCPMCGGKGKKKFPLIQISSNIKKHGVFPLSKDDFHAKHRKWNKYIWIPQSVGYQTIMSILLCYTDIIDASMIREEHMSNGNDSIIPLKCLKCNYDRWKVRISSLINDGHDCTNCAGQVPYDLPHFLFKTQSIKSIDFSKVKEEHIDNGAFSHVPCQCRICFFEWQPPIASLTQRSGCPDCNGHMLLNNKKHLERRLINKPHINLKNVLDCHIQGINSVIDVFCNICGYAWDTTIRNLLGTLHGCRGCLNSTCWDFKKLVEYVSNHNPKININQNTVRNMNIKTANSMIDILCTNCEDYWSESITEFIDRYARCYKCDYKRSMGITYISEFLDSIGVKYKFEETFDDLKDERLLRIDIFIRYFPGIPFSIALEYDGQYIGSHFKYTQETLLKHIDTVKKDRMKDSYCLKNNIHMFRVPYTLLPANVVREDFENMLKREFTFLSTCTVPTLRLADPEPYIKRDKNLELKKSRLRIVDK